MKIFLRIIRLGVLLGSTVGALPIDMPACVARVKAALKFDSKVFGRRAGARRFVAHLERMEQTLNVQKSSLDLVDTLLKDDIRSSTFKVEELARVYASQSKDLEKVFQKFKALEDRMGKVDEARASIKFIEGMAAPQGHEKEYDILKAYLRGRYEAERESFARFLVREQWTARDQKGVGAALRKAIERLESEKWKKNTKDRRRFLKAIDGHLKDIQKKKYDMNVLQGNVGIHELRRDLRRFLLQCQAADGLVLTQAERNAPRLPLETQNLLKAYAQPEARKYVTFAENPAEKRPLYLPEKDVIWVSEMVKRIGDVKELGEAEEMLVAAIEKTGLAGDESSAHHMAEIFLKMHPQYDPKSPSIFTRAQKLQSDLKRLKVIENLRAAVRESL